KLETLAGNAGDAIQFDHILMIADGENIKIGTPHLENAKVHATIVAHGRGKKIRIIKHRRRKHYHKEAGHRQNYTEVKITNIQ
ncbi:MAG: 50S ribosomal protein L21, partial [Gammaproteobacteria bacterium RIFCSPHIGHO2_12_38_15]